MTPCGPSAALSLRTNPLRPIHPPPALPGHFPPIQRESFPFQPCLLDVQLSLSHLVPAVGTPVKSKSFMTSVGK